MKILLVLAILGGLGVAALRRPKWDDATARERHRAGTMSEAEKRHRGYYPYHNGTFS